MRFFSLILLTLVFLTLPLTVTAQVPRVIPQEPGPDGGLVHVVQYGDTLDGIINAYINYGVTIDSLLELNGWRFKPQFIYVDDQIIVLPPGTTTPGNGLPVPVVDLPPPTAAPQEQTSVTRESAPAEAPPAEVKTAADIEALSAFEVVAPFVPILGDDSLIPAPPAEEAVEAQPTEPGAIPLIPTNTLIPESGTGPPIVTEEAPAEIEETAPTEAAAAPTEEAVATVEEVAPTEESIPTEVAIVPTVDVPLPTTVPEIAPNVEVAEVLAGVPDFTQQLGMICANFYDDINENGRLDAEEAPLAGGLILIGEGASATSDEDGNACLVDLGAGSIAVQAAAPDGYGITSPDALQVEVTSGQTTRIAFGASVGYVPPESLPAIEEVLSPPVPDSFRTTSAAAQANEDESLLDQLYAVSGLLVLALGILVFSGGILLALWLRLVRR